MSCRGVQTQDVRSPRCGEAKRERDLKLDWAMELCLDGSPRDEIWSMIGFALSRWDHLQFIFGTIQCGQNASVALIGSCVVHFVKECLPALNSPGWFERHDSTCLGRTALANFFVLQSKRCIFHTAWPSKPRGKEGTTIIPLPDPHRPNNSRRGRNGGGVSGR